MENIKNDTSNDQLKTVRQELEASLRSKYAQASREDLKALNPMNAYIAYYKKFGYTYHVLPQLESVIKGKSIPSSLPAVGAMFMAELKNMLLTAGHDLDKIQLPVGLNVSTGIEEYIAMNGKSAVTVSRDFILSDQKAVISSILRGPDLRTAITKHTTRVIYTVYSPPGVEDQLVHKHLNDIEAYVRMASQDSETLLTGVF